MTSIQAPEDLLARLRAIRHLIVTSHANPDGDAIGSELGVARILRSLGKSVTIWNADPAPSIYSSLPGFDRIHVGQKPPSRFSETVEAVLVLECPSVERTGLAARFGDLPLLNVDHHLGNQHYGIVNWVDTAAPAVGELIFHLAQSMAHPIDSDTATCLYLALASDTGGFRFSNTTPRAFQTAASLVELGASPERVAGWLFESRPLAMMKVLVSMMATLDLREGGRLCAVHVTDSMYAKAGASSTDTEGLIDYPRAIAGVDVVALFRELSDGKYKVSLRSRGETANVESVARLHGGGGHRNAAGFSIDGTFEEIKDRVLKDLGAALEAGA